MTNFKKLTITATLLTTLLGANAANAEVKPFKFDTSKIHKLKCPHFTYDRINICKDFHNGATCYYVVDSTTYNTGLSCVK